MRRRSPVKRKERRVPYAMGKAYAKARGTAGVAGERQSCSKGQGWDTPQHQKDGASYGWTGLKLRFPYDSTLNYTFYHQHSGIPGQSHFTLTAHCFDLWIQWEGKRHPVKNSFIFPWNVPLVSRQLPKLRHKLQKYCQGLFLVSVKTAFFFFFND